MSIPVGEELVFNVLTTISGAVFGLVGPVLVYYPGSVIPVSEELVMFWPPCLALCLDW